MPSNQGLTVADFLFYAISPEMNEVAVSPRWQLRLLISKLQNVCVILSEAARTI